MKLELEKRSIAAQKQVLAEADRVMAKQGDAIDGALGNPTIDKDALKASRPSVAT